MNFNDEKVIAGFISLGTAIIYLVITKIFKIGDFDIGAFSGLLALVGGCFVGSIVDDKINPPSGGAGA